MIFLRVSALLSLLLLSGCFEMQQDIIVGDDGTTQFKVELSIDAALIGMAQQGKPDNFCTSDVPKEIPKDLTFSAERTIEKGDIVCLIKVHGPTASVLGAFSGGKLLPTPNSQKPDGMQMSFTEDGTHKRIEITVFPTPKEEEEENPMQGMLIGATTGRFISWSVTAPEIIETSGELTEDGKTASFSLPVATLLTNKDETFKFYVLFSDQKPGVWKYLKSVFD